MPDRRLVYENGNKVDESRRLANIKIYLNDTLIRKYNFEYASLNNESSLSSLNKIKYIGSDDFSALHTITFGYYQSSSFYHNSTTYNASTVFSTPTVDNGVRLIDINNDGYIDLIKGRDNIRNVSINNKTGWKDTPNLNPPEDFINSANVDLGLRIADINNDGFPDMIQGWGGVRKAWLLNGTSWYEDSLTWAPSIDFASSSGTDEGTQLVDFNGDGKVDILQAKDGSAKKAYLSTGKGWEDLSSQWIVPTYFVKSDGSDYGSRLVDVNGDGLVDILEGYNFGTLTKNAWLNNGSGWVTSSVWIPPDVFTSSSRADNGLRLIDLNGDGLIDLLQDFKNGSTSEREAFINNGNGWSNSTPWNSPEPFTLDGKNIGRRIGDVNGDGFGDIIIGYNDGSNDIKRTVVRNSTIPYLLKNITTEFGGLINLNYEKSTIYNNSGDDGLSDIGFNIFVVKQVLQNNSLYQDFGILSNTSYSYFGGLYNYTDSEFRGFNIVNETLSDKSIISHYFHQSKELKGKEFRTETFDLNNNLFSKTENNYNITITNNNYKINLISSTNYLYDGVIDNPKITNVSFKYDNYSNIISKTQFGDASIQGDEKYENYSYAINITSWILDKPSWYVLFDSGYNKIRETKYFYDNKEYGAISNLGDLTKVENWLSTGGGNPTTRFRYDDYGNLIETTDPLGRITRAEYGLQDSTFTYPERIINALNHKTDYTFDIFGNVLTETKNGITKYNQYDVFGRISKEILPYDDNDLPTKSYTYNYDGISPESILIKQKTTSNNTLDVYYWYDGFGNLMQIKSPADYGQQVVKNIFYDGLYRVSSEQIPFFNDFNNDLTTITNLSNKTRYNYDTLGRIISVVNPDGTSKNTTYNKWEINDYDENNNRHTYLLDSYDRIIAVTEYNTDFYIGDNQTYNTTYSYNGRDELTGIRDTYGNEFNFSYDSLGRKVRLDDPDLGLLQYSYDLAGNLIRQSNSKSTVFLSYDYLNRILQKNSTRKNITFAYDNQYQGTLTNISSGNFTWAYKYDERLRIIKEIVYEGNEIDEIGLTYDSMDRLLEGKLSSSQDLDIYYGPEGKIKKIKGFLNDTRYNALGNPLNRTYFNSKITTFSYNPVNAYLRQIKTNTIQQLNYTYDNAKNIKSINDSVNNRSYAMDYDRLNRLTNVTIAGYKWIYQYDAIGNILKIVRNHSETISMKYDSDILAHFPYKIITTRTGVDIHRQESLNTSNRTRVIDFYLINERNSSLTNVNWTSSFDDGNSITSNVPFNLSVDENMLVIVEHNYGRGGNYIINLTGRDSQSSTDFERVKLLFGAIARGLDVLRQNASNVVTEFTARNELGVSSSSWNWSCTNGVSSSIPFNMSSYEELLVIMEHNYSLSSPNLTCRVYSSDGNQSKTKTLIFDDVKIENYNSTLLDLDTVQIKFEIKNYFATLNNIIWNISSNGNLYTGTISSLNQLQSSTISQEINFSGGGLKKIQLSVGVGNFTDSYTEYYYIKWLDLKQSYATLKNATTRIFDFILTNRNSVNTTTQFNISNPTLNYTTYLGNNESLIVVIEEDYSQGNKQIDIKVFNQTLQEDNLIEIFKIRQIQINSLQTLYENTRIAVLYSIVKNNIRPLNISWKLNNSESLISSTQNLELNTSEQVIVIIENNFTESGVFPMRLIINSSSYNDNLTGVAVS